MKNRLKILFLASEIAPFAKTGGLADVANALPKELFEMGHDVRIMMPKYGSISERKYVLRAVIRLKQIAVKMGKKDFVASAKSAFIPDTKVQVYFVEHKPFFDKKDFYVDSKTGKEFSNNAERFALFSRIALETVKLLHWEPDIIHCNDWQTALVPWILKNDYKNDPFFSKTLSLLQIHNVAFQGNFKPDVLPKIGLPTELAEAGSKMEFYGKINFLKLGIHEADFVTTVSPTYAAEIQSDETAGAGLNELLSSVKSKLKGIVNGVDYTVWNPETDEQIEKKFSATTLKDKQVNKEALAKLAGLEYDPAKPIIGIVSRLTEQKGLDLVLEAREELLKKDLQLVVLGTGDTKYHSKLQKMKDAHPDKMALFLKFDDALAHTIEAGADMFLMPSRFEPCGLNQLYSLRYGTLPIVHNVGGLADTVVDTLTNSSKGTGFTFDDYSKKAMLSAIDNALELFQNEKEWTRIVKRAMKQEFSWKSSAEEYAKVYTKMDSSKRKK